MTLDPDAGSPVTTPQRAVIPRQVLFGDPDRISPALSPDGTLLAYAAPHQGTMNIWVRPTGGSAPARPVTADRGRGITAFALCGQDRLVYAQDTGGDETWRLHLLDLSSGESRLVTPEVGVTARVLAYLPWHPDRMLVALNTVHPMLFDVHELDLATGELTLVASNPGHGQQPPFGAWLADADLRVRGGFVPTADGGVELHIRDDGAGPFRQLVVIGGADFDPRTKAAITRDGNAIIMATSLDAPAVRLVRIDAATGQITTISSDPSHDVTGVWADPVTLEPWVAAYAPDRTRYDLLLPDFAGDLDRIRGLDGGDPQLIGSARDGRLLLIATTAPTAPIRYHTYDRDTGRAGFLFDHRDDLAGYPLAATEPFRLTARDGLNLPGYLTRPVAADPGRPLPAVLVVHGGPWARDTWGHDPEVQWLADRGYAVVQVNFRGSTGYGKAHLNAGDQQWGRAMQTDLLDAIEHLARAGVIDPGRVAIYGGSYGGYAALHAAAFSPGVFRCAVSLCGPVHLATLIESLPPHAQPMIAMYHRRIGHPDRDAAALTQVSPLDHADAITTPLLFAHGANDPRVPVDQAEALVKALQASGVPHTYMRFPDEGHGLIRPDNRETFYGEAEQFLAAHLRGACQAGPQPPHPTGQAR